jgi:phospholipid/cholesterol/gamma-HCH transport system substrate-binding protein
MDERVVQFRVGVMVLATLIVTAILASLFGEVPWLAHSSYYMVTVRFPEAPGVTADTPVRMNGILIGRVADIRFADDDRSVIVALKIDGNRKLYRDEVCRISNSLMGLGGDTVLEIVRAPAPEAQRTPLPTSGAEMPSGTTQDPLRAVSDLKDELVHTLGQVGVASGDLHVTLTRINNLLGTNEQRINHIIAEADETLQILRTTMTNANDIIGDPKVRANFKESAEELPKVLTKARDTAERMGVAMDTVQRNLHNLEGLTEPLGRRGETLVARMDEGTLKLNRAMDDMLRFSATLNNPNSSLGQLLNSPELYQHINRAARNIDELTRELKPVVDDARVFSDKIARHPEMLGVRGAIQRSPGIK